jgi:hypothetical protein
VVYDYVQELLMDLNKKAKTKKQCGDAAKKRKAQGKKPRPCYRGYQLVIAQQEADIEFPGDFDNDPGPNGIGGNGPAFDITPPFPCVEVGGTCGGAASVRPGPPCFNGYIDGTAGEGPNDIETNPGADDTGVFLGDPGPPNTTPVNDPVTGQPAPFDYNGDSSSNHQNNATPGTQGLSCGPDTTAGIFGATAPPATGYPYASDCPDNNPIGGGPYPGAAQDKSDTTSSCVFHGIDGDVSLTMRDAIIARKGAGVKTSNSRSGNYTAGVQFTIAGQPVKFLRGWTATDAKVRGKSFTFVNTHLESLDNGTVREDQASELLTAAGITTPTVIVGDLNSDPASANPEGPPAYNRLAAAGFSSLTGPALTSGHGELLSDKSNVLDNSRIDHILTNAAGLIKAAGGSQVIDTFANGLWNSDHGGVFVRIKGKKKK